MAKKIRFPLEMKNSVQVRTLSELKEHWDIDKIEGYFLDGKLETWLRDRYYEAEAEKVSELDGNDKNRRQKLCEIFGMEYEADEGELADAEELRDKQARVGRLRQYTNDKNILDHIEHVAFDTEEILDAFDAGAETIYLVNNEFEIPLQVKNKKYIGVGKVIAKIDSNEPVDFEALGIRFENVDFDAKYAEVSKAENFDEKFAALFEAEEYEKAKAYCKKAAENGNAYAMFIVGDGYHGGNDKWFGEEDQQKALEWFEKSAEAGYPDAMLALGYMYSCCNEIESDIEKAIFWCKKCAETGNEAAMRNLGEFYENEKYEGCDNETAIAWYRKAAEKGDTKAMYALSNIYYGEEDYDKAREYAQKSADAGYVGGMRALGILYGNGQGFNQDSMKAVKWYQKAAEAGDGFSMNQLGCAYLHGEGISKNEKKAVEWFRKGAEAGSPDAMNNMGWVYEHGQGVKQDNRIAVKWYRKAAEAGNGTGMNNLGLAYDNGTGVEQNEEEAVKWYRKAIECGNGCAAWNLSVTCDKNGDSEQAEHWRKKAKELGYEAKTEDSSDCFITTAVCSGFNKPDDCYELTMFRHFRDSWLLQQADGSALVNEYYRTAPHIVASIDHLKEAKAIYRAIWNEYLLPCLRYLEKQKYIECKTLYVKMVQDLQKQFLV